VISIGRRPVKELPAGQQWLADDITTALKNEYVDAVICCLGTTIAKAGSQEKFRYVDHDLVVDLGRWAKSQGVPAFSVVSAIGADPSSRIFYNRVKGEMERDLQQLALPSLNIFQPSILTGPRDETRIGERIGILFMTATAPLMIGLLRKYKPMPHDVLAKALIVSALKAEPGKHGYLYDDIVDAARSY
jgi:uncharacterized protein YbjT (DUF2867 family)